MKKRLLIVAVLALSGCASSGPVPIGPDTFMITKQSAGGIFVAPGAIKVEIIKEAVSYCSSQDKTFQIVNTNELSAVPGARMPSAEVQFMCLSKGDRELVRPKMQQGANTVIELRNR